MYKIARNLTVLGAGLSASAIVGWLLLRESKRRQSALPVVVKSQARAPESVEGVGIRLPLAVRDEAEEPAPAASGEMPDDLTRIKDIGPRFAEALHAIGITRFAQLAEQSPEALAERLVLHVNVGPHRIREKDWIGQAARLAKGSGP